MEIAGRHCLRVGSQCLAGCFRLELTYEITFNIQTKLSNDVDCMRVAHCGLCLGFGEKART